MTGWLLLALVGAVVALDATSFPQVMVSRPLVAGALGGLAFGRPAEGAVVGLVLEVFHVGTLPIGAARYPEGGTAACATAGGLAASGGMTGAPALLLAVVIALAWERVAGRSVEWARRVNERVVLGWTRSPAPDRALERGHLLAAGIDAARGIGLTLGGAVITAGALGLVATWPVHATVAAGALAVAAAAVLGGTLGVFGGWREKGVTFLLGVVCGLILLAVV